MDKHRKMDYIKLINIINESGKIYGIDIVITKDDDSESYCNGFIKGKEYIKNQLLELLKDYYNK